MSEQRTIGRYEVAIDSGVELMDYREFPPVLGEWRLRPATDPVKIGFDGRTHCLVPCKGGLPRGRHNEDH